jgi:hypothetical protein
MTADEFRHLALSLPGATEQAHNNHPDFRVGKRIFATLFYPDPAWAMIKLPQDHQESLITQHPALFKPANGAWGRQGSTLARLADLDQPTALHALRRAWEGATG